MGPPFPISRLLSSKPHICSCELCPGLWGPPAPSPSGTYKCHLPTDTPSALGQQPNLSFPEGIPLCLRLLTGRREGEGSWGTGPEESLWTAWQFGGGGGCRFGFSRTPQTMQLFFKCKKRPEIPDQLLCTVAQTKGLCVCP